MNILLFLDVLAAILVGWTGAGFVIGYKMHRKGIEVSFATWMFILFFGSIAYVVSRVFS